MTEYVKYLMWLPILAVPFLVFWAKPQTPPAWRIARLLVAVALLYGAFGLTAFHEYMAKLNVMYPALEQHSDCRPPSCTNKTISQQSHTVMGIVLRDMRSLAWPLFFYVGLCELAWRVWHREELKILRGRETGVFFSTWLMIAALLYPALIYLDAASGLGHFHALRV